MRSERYFLPPLELTDDELAALQTCLYLLEGKFAYAEPLRLALQNLALGRAGLRRGADRHRAARRGARPRVLGRDAGPARQARGGDLEAAHGQVPVLVDLPRRGARAHGQPVRALPGRRRLVRGRARPRRRGRAHVPRLAHPRRDPLRHAPRARLPPAGRVRRRPATAAARRGRSATPAGEARIEVGGDTAWWVERTFGDEGRGRRLRDRVLEPAAARLVGAAPGRPRGAAGARRAAARGRAGAEARARAARGRAGRARRRERARGRGGRDRAADRARRIPSASPSCRRCSPTCSTAAARTRRPSSRRRSSSTASTSRSSRSRSTSRC